MSEVRSEVRGFDMDFIIEAVDGRNPDGRAAAGCPVFLHQLMQHFGTFPIGKLRGLSGLRFDCAAVEGSGR